jgi:hypothetical protein
MDDLNYLPMSLVENEPKPTGSTDHRLRTSVLPSNFISLDILQPTNFLRTRHQPFFFLLERANFPFSIPTWPMSHVFKQSKGQTAKETLSFQEAFI